MIPGTARSLQFSTDNAGFWLMHCHVGDHINAGMKAMYQVNPGNGMETLGGVRPSGTVRWAPLGRRAAGRRPQRSARTHAAAAPGAAASRSPPAPALSTWRLPLTFLLPSLPAPAHCRTYYVEAEEVEWDYAPRGGDYCTGSLLPWTEEQEVFTEANHLSPGSK